MSMQGQQAIKDQVTAKMVAALQSGVVPWHKPWTGSGAAGFPCSLSTRKRYRGINIWILGLTAMDRGYRSPWWGTYTQIERLGGQVRKGQNHHNGTGSTGIVLYKTHTKGWDEEHDRPNTFTVMQYFSVFNAEQADGLPDWCYPSIEDRGGSGLITDPQEVLMGYLHRDGAPSFRYAGDRAYYNGGNDCITIPAPETFDSPEHRYATEFHECGHSTGHPDRLNRPGIAEFDHFGSGQYAQEELVAEMASVMLCTLTGIDGEGIFDNSAAYLGNWLTKLNDDHSLIFRAARESGKAVDVILGTESKEE